MIPETGLLVLDLGDVDQFYRKGQVLAGERVIGIDRHRLWRHIDDRDPAVHVRRGDDLVFLDDLIFFSWV